MTAGAGPAGYVKGCVGQYNEQQLATSTSLRLLLHIAMSIRLALEQREHALQLESCALPAARLAMQNGFLPTVASILEAESACQASAVLNNRVRDDWLAVESAIGFVGGKTNTAMHLLLQQMLLHRMWKGRRMNNWENALLDKGRLDKHSSRGPSSRDALEQSVNSILGSVCGSGSVNSADQELGGKAGLQISEAAFGIQNLNHIQNPNTSTIGRDFPCDWQYNAPVTFESFVREFEQLSVVQRTNVFPTLSILLECEEDLPMIRHAAAVLRCTHQSPHCACELIVLLQVACNLV